MPQHELPWCWAKYDLAARSIADHELLYMRSFPRSGAISGAMTSMRMHNLSSVPTSPIDAVASRFIRDKTIVHSFDDIPYVLILQQPLQTNRRRKYYRSHFEALGECLCLPNGGAADDGKSTILCWGTISPRSDRSKQGGLTKLLPLQQTGSWVHDVLLPTFPEQVRPTIPLTEPVLTPKNSRITLVVGFCVWGVGHF